MGRSGNPPLRRRMTAVRLPAEGMQGGIFARGDEPKRRCGETRRKLMQDRTFGGGVSIQDADLLVRLNSYFDHLEQRLDQGQGWLIFNSSRERGARILRLLLARLDGYRPFVSLLHLPWRDFALHAYISTVALPRDASLVAEEEEGSARKREFAIASG